MPMRPNDVKKERKNENENCSNLGFLGRRIWWAAFDFRGNSKWEFFIFLFFYFFDLFCHILLGYLLCEVV